MNKLTTFFVIAILAGVMGCGWLFGSPTSVVKELIERAKKGDADGMVALFSRKSQEETSLADQRKNAESFIDTIALSQSSGHNVAVNKIRETIEGDRARVFFLLGDTVKHDTVGMGFALVKEDGKWKIFHAIDVSEEDEPFDTSFETRKPRPTPSSTVSTEIGDLDLDDEPPPPPPSKTPSSDSPSKVISGGILNGKAISLPKPVYPPAAKAVKASGQVMVQVTVDETGKVTSANAVSGHPLLKAAAEAAARSATFNPTLLAGKPVVVKGMLTFNFSSVE